MSLADILLFFAVFFMTPLIILIYALEDSPYIHEEGVGYRKGTEAERSRHWANLWLTLAGGWLIFGIIYGLLEIFS